MGSTLSAVARPYAQAAYEFSETAQQISAWNALLQMAAGIVQQPEVHALLSNTCISARQWLSFFEDSLRPYLDEHRKNFLRLVMDNRRMAALPEIAVLFKEYEAIHQRIFEVQLTTAIPLDEAQKKQFTEKLSEVLKHPVSLRCVVDEHILGGALVRAGDKVIDGSVRGQLTRLLESI